MGHRALYHLPEINAVIAELLATPALSDVLVVAAAPSARLSSMPIPALTSCAATNLGTLLGAMPAKLSLNIRPNAAAGLAKEVEAVNQ